MREQIESLFRACESGDLQRARAILDEGHHDVDGNNRWGVDIDPRGWRRTPLHVAVSHGHLALAEWLLAEGADPNPVTKFGDTPLHLILEPPFPPHGRDAIALLLRHGADPHRENQAGETPLTLARKQPAIWAAAGDLFPGPGGT